MSKSPPTWSPKNRAPLLAQVAPPSNVAKTESKRRPAPVFEPGFPVPPSYFRRELNSAKAPEPSIPIDRPEHSATETNKSNDVAIPSTQYQALIDAALANALGKHVPSAIVLYEQLQRAQADIEQLAAVKSKLEQDHAAEISSISNEFQSVREMTDSQRREAEIKIGMTDSVSNLLN